MKKAAANAARLNRPVSVTGVHPDTLLIVFMICNAEGAKFESSIITLARFDWLWGKIMSTAFKVHGPFEIGNKEKIYDLIEGFDRRLD
jgi:hypothetical protein